MVFKFFESTPNRKLQEIQHRRQQQHDRKTKKSRENRKLQLYHRKLRKQGVDSHIITEVIDSSIDIQQLKTDDVHSIE